MTDANGDTDYSGTDWAIDGTTLEVGSSPDFDYESGQTETIFVKVSDGTNTAYVEQMTITISDTEIDITANSASLAENAGNGDEVLTMATTGDDRAADGGFEIDSGNTGTAFAIDAATGVLTVADATAIDYETLATYTLVISVNDGTGDDVTESVTITITDVNDNSPVFSDGDSASASTE